MSGALRAYESMQRIFLRLSAQDPVNAEWQYNLSLGHEKIGDARLALRDVSGARRAYEAGKELSDRLVATDSGNATWQRGLVVSHAKLSLVAREAGQHDEERQHLLRCRDVLQEMRQRGMYIDPSMASLSEDPEQMP